MKELIPTAVVPFAHYAVHCVGSKVILGEGADTDIVVLVSDAVKCADSLVVNFAATMDGSGACNDGWVSLRVADVNYIITDDMVFYNAFVAANAVTKYLQDSGTQSMLMKSTRIQVHQRVFTDWYGLQKEQVQ